MLRDQLVSACSGRILDTVRSHRGWLSFVSAESQVNRKYFNRRKFQTLRFFRLVRVLYVLAMRMGRGEFVRLGADLFGDIWDRQDQWGYELPDECRDNETNKR